MARGLNKVMIIGNLGADPEMRYTQNGTPVTTFNVATNRQWVTSSGERREETEWFRVVAWSRLAEFCNQYLSKGRRVYVEGRLQTRQWEDREGNVRYTTEIVAQEVILLDAPPRREERLPGAEEREGDLGFAGPDLDEEDIPF